MPRSKNTRPESLTVRRARTRSPFATLSVYLLAATSTLLIIVLQILLHTWQISADNKVFGEVILITRNAEETIETSAKALEEEGIFVMSSRFVRFEDGRIRITYHVRAGEEVSAQKSARLAKVIPELVSLEVHSDL